MSSDVEHFYVRRSESLGLFSRRTSPDEAWQLLDSVLDAVGGALGGATYDIRTGRVIAWRDGQRIEPSSP